MRVSLSTMTARECDRVGIGHAWMQSRKPPAATKSRFTFKKRR